MNTKLKVYKDLKFVLDETSKKNNDVDIKELIELLLSDDFDGELYSGGIPEDGILSEGNITYNLDINDGFTELDIEIPDSCIGYIESQNSESFDGKLTRAIWGKIRSHSSYGLIYRK